MIDKWTAEHPGIRGSTKPILHTSNLSRRSAAAISRLRAGLTTIHLNPLRHASPGKCGTAAESSRHLLLDYRKSQPTLAWNLLLQNQTGPRTQEPRNKRQYPTNRAYPFHGNDGTTQDPVHHDKRLGGSERRTLAHGGHLETTGRQEN